MSSTPQNQLKRKLSKALKVLCILYVMITAALYFLQEKILFLPTELPQDYSYSFEYPFEELFLSPENGVSINALHFKAESPKGVILYFHGNAGDLSRWGTIAQHFVYLGYDVFIMDYRTYGKSTGPLNEQSFYDDAHYCYKFLLEQYPEEQIVVYGRSLGTGMATYLASKHQPKQLILETPYHSILDVAQHRFPLLPVSLLLKYKFPSYDYISDVDCPITIFHGTDDSVVPYSSAQKLKSLAPSGTEFVTIDGGGHNNLIEFQTYKDKVKAILQ